MNILLQKKDILMLRYLTLLLVISFNSWSANFEKFFPHLIKVEGTFFTVTQYDAGGATKFGVTYSVYKTWCNGRVVVVSPCDKDGDGVISTNDLRLSVFQDVKPIYQTQYWNVCHADLIENQAVVELIVDMVVHCGVGFDRCHIKALQRIVGVVADGKIGAKTLLAVNRGHSKNIYDLLSVYRIGFYKKLTLKNHTQKRFLRGWLNRLHILKSIHFSHEKVK